jgi:hypothetical protein
MVDPRRSQAYSDGVVFGYLGVRVSGGGVWTIRHGAAGRYLGPLAGARAGLDEPRRSWIGSSISSVLTGSSPPKNAKLYVGFADGSRYERIPLPWVRELDWPKIGGEIGRFNEAAARRQGPPTCADAEDL